MSAQDSRPAKDKAMTATWYSKPIETRQLFDMSLQIVNTSTDTPAGTYTIEGSNDPLVDDERWSDAGNTSSSGSWVDISARGTIIGAANLTISGALNVLVFMTNPPRYVRVKYTRSSGGTGSLGQVYVNGKV